jgi:hypothetical protein
VATFGGFYKKELTLQPGERVLLDFSFFTGGVSGCFKFLCGGTCRPTFRNLGKQEKKTRVQVFDARKKEQEEGLTKREFFDRYGFVLLQHRTEMKAEDWLVNSARPAPDAKDLDPYFAKAKELSSPVKDIYAKEIDPLIRDLLPSAGEIFYPLGALRRGPGGPNNFYGLGVHQDYGLYPKDMVTTRFNREESFEDWEKRLNCDGTAGYCVINFWRPVLPMRGPVQNTPLAVCDPRTVNVEDVVPQDLYGFVPGGQHNMGVKFNADQRWYYYPGMTKDEVLVFRQFLYEKGVEAPYSKLKTVFHTAFHHPAAPKDAESRCSSEYRVGVWLKE